MNLFKSCSKLFSEFIKFLINFLAPEDKRIETILKIDPSEMLALLPKSKVNLPNIFVLFDYNNKIVKMIIKSIKYKNNQNLKKRIAVYLYDELVAIASEISIFEGSPPIIVPMPMSKTEKNKKGFNQCEEVLKAVSTLAQKNLEISFKILNKIRETRRQTTLGKTERLENLKNSMLAEAIVKNKTIIVFDDVYTTLATWNEAKRALLEAGAKKVLGVFIAH